MQMGADRSQGVEFRQYEPKWIKRLSVVGRQESDSQCLIGILRTIPVCREFVWCELDHQGIDLRNCPAGERID